MPSVPLGSDSQCPKGYEKARIDPTSTDEYENVCPICLDDMVATANQATIIALYPCRHVLHKDCYSHQPNSVQCPVCRQVPIYHSTISPGTPCFMNDAMPTGGEVITFVRPEVEPVRVQYEQPAEQVTAGESFVREKQRQYESFLTSEYVKPAPVAIQMHSRPMINHLNNEPKEQLSPKVEGDGLLATIIAVSISIVIVLALRK